MTKKKSNQKWLTLNRMLLMFTLIPMIVAIIALAIVSSRIMTNNLEESTFSELKIASQGLKTYYEYDLIHDIELVDGFVEYNPEEYIDMIYQQTGVNLTLFKDNVRFMTSLRNEDGTRNEGTKASDAVWAAVSSGQDYTSDDVTIGGIDYFVYYTPMFDENNNVVGMAFSGKPTAQVQTAERHIYLLILIISVVLIAIFVGTGLYFAKKVTDPIKIISEDIKSLSEGNLNIGSAAKSNIRETNTLIDSMKNLSASLKEIVTNIKGASNTVTSQASELSMTTKQISDASDTVSNAVRDIANGATDQANTIQNASTNLASLSDAIKTVADNAEQLTAMAADMDNAATTSATALQNLHENMQEISKAIAQIADIMQETNYAVDRVNEKVEGINSIASQTNLLSLNASIEAARAGEAGRGFSVVAEEIGKLATDSATMSAEIKEEMNNLLGHSKSATAKTTEMSKLGTEVMTIVDDTTNMVNNLINNVSATVDGVNNISALTEECNASKDIIVDAMTSLSAISEENAASTEETGATMQELNATVNGIATSAGFLNSIAEQLKNDLGFFQT